ncbi:hypothetical protein [Winogradskyella wichelsiae]|uniref:hypothetical protein n=1 Tax=Winogradskyella wichelsiae TaxID=2697007 RepID=UPI0015C9EF36|nr:hypothetical protein [Winogradskyella wichelsiae]
MKNILKTFLAVSVLTLSSCGMDSLVPKNLNDADDIAEIKATVEEKLGADKMVNKLTLRADDYLSSQFERAQITYMRDGKEYSQDYFLKVVNDPKKSMFQRNLHDGAIKISEFNFEQVPASFNKAVEMIKAETDEYHDFEMYEWEFVVDKNNEITSTFTLNGTKKSEGSHMEGKSIVTNYYEFKFTSDKDGNLQLKM